MYLTEAWFILYAAVCFRTGEFACPGSDQDETY